MKFRLLGKILYLSRYTGATTARRIVQEDFGHSYMMLQFPVAQNGHPSWMRNSKERDCIKSYMERNLIKAQEFGFVPSSADETKQEKVNRLKEKYRSVAFRERAPAEPVEAADE